MCVCVCLVRPHAVCGLDAGIDTAEQTIESVYLMWRTTGNSIWRERGWEMFEGVRKYSTVPGGGMASIKDVRSTTHDVLNDMPR
jgi:hypothetical protein